MKTKRLRLFVMVMSLSLILIGGTIVSAQENASEDDMFTLEEITVTGSRIERTDITSVSPITVLTEADILEAGNVTMEDFVQKLPSVTGGSFGHNNNNGIPGFATVSLRGLGSNRTLVLLNGQRMPSAGENGFVDLNMIPAGMLERVEVLRDGASTTYGSDAIAGVVNFITKRDFEGAQFQVQYDITGKSDGRITTASGLIGANADSDRGNVVFGFQYTDRKEIWQGDRDYSDCPLYENPDGSLYCAGSGTSYPAQFFNDNYDGHILVDDVIVPFDSEQHAYNWSPANYLVDPMSVLSTYASGHYDLVQESAFGTVTATIESIWSNRQSDQLMAPVGTFWGPLVPATNPGNPTGEDVFVTRRLVETGGRRWTQDASSWRLITGLEGMLNNDWKWNASYNYGRWVDARIVYGQVNKLRAVTVFDPDLCAEDPNCPGVWDPFRTDTLTQDIQDYLLVNHSPVQRSTMETLQANLIGDLGDYELPGGPVQWAVGYEHRMEKALFQPDGAAAMDLIYYVAPDRTEGDYTVDEFYGEVRVPILEGAPFADMLAAELSVRRSDYSLLDDATTNWKYGLEWAPVPSLRFRTVYTEGFRMANISELFGPQQLTAQPYSDPCENYGSGANATVTANCQADGLPPDFQLSSNQATGILGGNPDLKPEESESLTLGAVITPEILPNLSVSLDYFNIKITDAVGTAGTQNVITGCYNSPGFESPWCDLITGPTHPLVGEAPSPTSPYRNALNNISGILLTNANLASYKTEGVDFGVDYVWEFDVSHLNLSVMGTYLMKYNYIPYEGAETVELAGYFAEDNWSIRTATYPEWKFNFNFNYVMGDWGFTWAPRWFSSTEDIYADEANAVNTAKSMWYHDVQATYAYEGWNFALGIRNLLDEDPPYVTNYDDMNTIHSSYDLAGRYFYARATYSF